MVFNWISSITTMSFCCNYLVCYWCYMWYKWCCMVIFNWWCCGRGVSIIAVYAQNRTLQLMVASGVTKVVLSKLLVMAGFFNYDLNCSNVFCCWFWWWIVWLGIIGRWLAWLCSLWKWSELVLIWLYLNWFMVELILRDHQIDDICIFIWNYAIWMCLWCGLGKC